MRSDISVIFLYTSVRRYRSAADKPRHKEYKCTTYGLTSRSLIKVPVPDRNHYGSVIRTAEVCHASVRARHEVRKMELNHGKVTYTVDEMEKLKKIFDTAICTHVRCNYVCCQMCPFHDVKELLKDKYGLDMGIFHPTDGN